VSCTGALAGVFVATDSSSDVFFSHDATLDPTGWNIVDIRFAYDQATDTGYFGACTLPLHS
jgi:hypothetical protein